MMRFKRRQRTTFSLRQLETLREALKKTHYPDAQFRDHLAEVTSLDPARIQVWFQNQRAKEKKRRNLRDQTDWPIQDSPIREERPIALQIDPSRKVSSSSFQSPPSATSSLSFEFPPARRVKQVCVFSSSMANEAAKAISEGKFDSLVEYHREKFAHRAF